MDYKISRIEFAVLAYLRENATSFDRTGAIPHERVAESLAMQTKDIDRAVSYLTSLGFTGAPFQAYTTFGGTSNRNVFLEAKGEHFMRCVDDEIEDELTPTELRSRLDGGRVTAAVAGAIYDLGKAILVRVFTDVALGAR